MVIVPKKKKERKKKKKKVVLIGYLAYSQALEVLFWPKYHKVYGSVHSNARVILYLRHFRGFKGQTSSAYSLVGKIKVIKKLLWTYNSLLIYLKGMVQR